jgi:putative transposase
VAEDPLLHANHGTQFAYWSFEENTRRWGLLGSFGTVGDCFDNAAMESFCARMQVEPLNTRKWASYLGNISPTEFETLWASTYSIPQLA